MAKKTNKPANKATEDDFIVVNANEAWLTGYNNTKIYDSKFFQIVSFYCLHSPCKNMNYSPNTLESLGWKSTVWRSELFRQAFDDFAGFVNGDNFRCVGAKDNFRSNWEDYGIKDFTAVPVKEYAVFTDAGEGNPRMDMLCHIRNAFAHGRFAVKNENYEDYYFFEDVDKTLTVIKVTARICVKKKTLMNWIKFFKKENAKAKELSALFADS